MRALFVGISHAADRFVGGMLNFGYVLRANPQLAANDGEYVYRVRPNGRMLRVLARCVEDEGRAASIGMELKCGDWKHDKRARSIVLYRV